MKQTNMPEKHGLYDPKNEHDACGIGFVANIKGRSSHKIVEQGIHMLCQLKHRGGEVGGDTGDGAGILLEISDDFFQEACAKIDIVLPEKYHYAVGMFNFPQNVEQRKILQAATECFIDQEGQDFLGWRKLPTDVTKVGLGAQKTEPAVYQLFIAKDEALDEEAFERKLYLIRKQIENFAAGDARVTETFYVPSLSTRTVIFKGMLTPEQINQYYLDLADPAYTSAYALVHSRFSTNTFPSWERAHPYRYLIHNGEINTQRGNLNWMKAREKRAESDLFGADLAKVMPVIDEDGSDSATLDNALEFLVQTGRTLPHAAMMLIPEPWDKNKAMTDPKRAFYEYHSTLMEPWDGPTSISFTNGRVIGTILDRNGLRPARYYETRDHTIIYSSETGVVPVEPEEVIRKVTVGAGTMLLIDLEKGEIISDDVIKSELTTEKPYREWLNAELTDIGTLTEQDCLEYISLNKKDCFKLQRAFGYTQDELSKILIPMVTEKKDPMGAMGYDAPLAVLSYRPQLLFNYFKQLFAQVTNPPIDGLREESVISTMTLLGNEGNILNPTAENANRIRLETPILSRKQYASIALQKKFAKPTAFINALFKAEEKENLAEVLDRLFAEADAKIEAGAELLVITDDGTNDEFIGIPALLMTSGLHHHLVKRGTRMKVSLIVKTAEARDVHHCAMLVGYGADAIFPYLAIDVFTNLIKDGRIKGFTVDEAESRYIEAITDGILKVMSKIGISTVQSYRGAQIFEAIGIGNDVIADYFPGTASQLGGIPLEVIAQESWLRHREAFHDIGFQEFTLDTGGEYQWRSNGEYHVFNPLAIHSLQQATRENNRETYDLYSDLMQNQNNAFLRGLLTFNSHGRKPIPIEEVEPAEAIFKRFKSGAMSYGSISQEAHEALAIAMNRIGGKSNSGEGGENPDRFLPDANGDWRRSAIKQVASGRFGVTSHYLVNADELQIKMAQGAKPGEGGHLPGEKVYPWISKTRGSTTGVGLISPPPHHDIYSIEDLSQLIFDLKNANKDARINVKLVSKTGIGTIAAGVAKGFADVILVSGYEGGTGAAARSSIRHTGVPWEIGLAETHQTLLLNGLRNQVVVETDGKLMTGKDVLVAAMLGAEEYGFATAPLVTLGCVMMRVCHMDTCPVGVATQNPELRKKFGGSADYVVNFFNFIVAEMRETMAELGFRSLEEIIGHKEYLETHERKESHWKAKHLDFSNMLYMDDFYKNQVQFCTKEQDHKIDQTLDMRELQAIVAPAIECGEKVTGRFPIRNIDRAVGTITGSYISRKYGAAGLPEDTIDLTFTGAAGQSFGAFAPKGMTLRIEGDANDYFGKGLSGAKLIVSPDAETPINAHDSAIVGNVTLYGATDGEAYIHGKAGARFAVRNSGADVVVEGIGDNGCEYMTGGTVVVLGETGENFAAGMSGGVAYVYAPNQANFTAKVNPELVTCRGITTSREERKLRELVENHVRYTGSEYARKLLTNWERELANFVYVIPNEFEIMLTRIEKLQSEGQTHEAAELQAFYEHKDGLLVEVTK
ncbi:glutamate synthase large subunit [Paenilisteria rocourtiae]|uniref:Glutamate synthase (NADPH) large subunit n=1 Tax=Listeria rocourtiae TaxID=647910 RepID=A0A4R6ZIB6_9LIST|nr:glutamate synthase large subunit [Listeria rocourtiae]EUJ47680.1 glutamate synthase [Listeria rocourtiae FSL F6-920]TDR51983.1 glutamate synthase (NADPH) large subunit [Listeria rocourtiae]